MLYSIVIPCYNSSHTIRQVVEETAEMMKKLEKVPFEFVLTDDCSPDDGKTVAILEELANKHSCVKVVELAKNAGQHNASMAALNYADGDIIISMDDDGQTHCSQLCKLFEKIDDGYDLVFGYYEDKKHNRFRNFGSWVNFETVRVLIGKPRNMKTSSFWVTRKYVRDYLIQYKSQYTHLQGLFLRTVSYDKIASVPVEHFKRLHGVSNYTFKKLVDLWSNIIGFSTVPLRMAQCMGALMSALGLLGATAILVKKIIRPSTTIGWSSLMFALFFFSGITILFLGIIGEYIGRMFQSLNNSPQYVVRKVYKNSNIRKKKTIKKGD